MYVDGSTPSETPILSETYSYYTSNGASSVKDAVKEISYNDNSKISYTYDSQGRIKTESRNGTLYVTYTYDKLGQLTEAYYHTLNQVHGYSYDKAGNITGRDVRQNGELIDYLSCEYGNETWGDLITYNSQYVTLHDSMGNPIEYTKQADGSAPIDNAYLVWENGRELASINNKTTNTPIASYKYNSSGLRTYKSSGVTGDVRYLYDDNGNLISEQRGDCALTYYYDGNGVRTHFTRQGEDGTHTYYYRYNLQGDVIALLDSTGTVVAEYNYTPYGDHIGTVTGIAAYNPFRYRGYYFDSETGYYYLQSRYYNPFTCRFINADKVMGVNNDTTAYNLFTYCGNEPINRYDVSGHAWDNILDTILHNVNMWAISIGLDTAAFAGFLLQMNKDNSGVYHAKFDCWQQHFGYNILYDIAFDIGTSMVAAEFPFYYNGDGYTIWAWKGDYINLGAGAELGIYRGASGHRIVDKDLAMCMGMIVEYNDVAIINYFPNSPQWWITSFNPQYLNVDANDLTAIMGVEFYDYGMYYAFKREYCEDQRWIFYDSMQFAIIKL